MDSDFEEYTHLENKDVAVIKKEDLPEEFTDMAYETVVDFIQKTRCLDKEWALFFDYVTGEILKCVVGEHDNVDVTWEDDEFEGKQISSIHNHPKEVLSPPSGKDFGILKRDFEDYELIAGFEYFWIFKVNGIHEGLINEMCGASDAAFISSFLHCISRYNDNDVFNRMHDLRYGGELSKYINNKNIKDIQLTRLEYDNMTNKLNTAEYGCRKRITNPEVIKFAKEFEKCPYTPSGKDIMYAFYQSIGMDVEYDEIFAD
ncbi:hypothetical protein [uncultured Methanobrevibacter sp.]|uniref:hypothetical protein n=1 Tax=uncultured Methanobrevibacter sp. TaxID=253161 RepID=UPI00261F704E|nr:hypothetical protein [uncultured Methanobrevibacter sp.]